MRFVAWLLTAVSAALLAGGCGADEPAPGGSLQLAEADLASLVGVSPDATGWTWTAKPGPREAPASAVAEWKPTLDLQKTYRDAQLAAGLVRTASTSWWDEGKKASSFADLYRTPEGARSALAAGKAFAAEWFPSIEHREVEELDVGRLGDARWAVRHGTDAAAFVEIGWVRGNAVLGVYVNCIPCESDLATAARAWAEEVDAAAVAAAE